ncbi:unnamed protein product [Arabis nemorensis]|uniref:Cystatin domain-containing protein n=1 Tax=Arabis nemorensis TaxID=586526 RepID=A0A565CMD5_9BRAS|nr:unnamed protein product [Arabis nemorensis]
MDSEEERDSKQVSSPSSVESRDEEDVRLFEEEFKKHGDYDFDASKVGSIVVFYPLVFGSSEYATEPETDGELMERLSKIALKEHNDNKKTNFELVRAVKANWSLGGGNIFSITLEAKDASLHSGPVPFHARVSYIPGGTKVFDINPKPQPKP